LPVAMAQRSNARLDLYQPGFGRGQVNLPGKKETGESLDMSSAQAAPWLKTAWQRRGFHRLILYNENRFEGWSQIMPIFEYVCQKCNHEFEALVYGSQKAECPKCESKKLIPRLSVFAVATKGSVASTSPVGACGACGDPRGTGACSMPDFSD